MNHNPTIPTVDHVADGLNIHVFLQQTVEHYPRQAAFSFTALLLTMKLIQVFWSVLSNNRKAWPR